MLYGVELQTTVARPPKHLSAALPIALQEAVALRKSRRATTAIASGQLVSFAATKLKGAPPFLIGTAQSVTKVATPVGPPVIGSGDLRESARTLQPGNLQAAPVLRVNWKHPLAQGLVYLEMFDQLRTSANDYPYVPQFIGNHGALTTTATTTQAGPGGVGLTMSANTGGLIATSGNHVRVPSAIGSFFAYVTADFAANDSIHHSLMVTGRETGGSEADFFVFKFSDNNAYFGFTVSGVNYRAIAAATGLWSAGDTFMYGGTWNFSNVNSFVKGKLAATSSPAPSPFDTSVAPSVFRLGNASTGTAGWGSTQGKNFIYYIAMWNRELSAAECNYLNQNPYCFMKGQRI